MLNGKITMRVAITGAATGIGAVVAARLKQQGHEVIAFDISEPKANIDQWIHTDLSDPQSIEAAINAATGSFDALINNAGLPPRDGLTEKVLLVNYFGLKAFLLGMLDQLSDGAAIVNTASRAGAMWRDNIDEVKALMALSSADLPAFIARHNIDTTRAYNLSKEAVIVMTMAMTDQLTRKSLRMNSVSPAAVSTGILPDFAKAFGDKMEKNLARVGRPGTPEEVAEVIVFLASTESSWIRGQDIVIDGGMSASVATEMMGLAI
jgi:NAD(P)-dependent dehydrogenase (short-subunit alcohol dehydrogenase family)